VSRGQLYSQTSQINVILRNIDLEKYVTTISAIRPTVSCHRTVGSMQQPPTAASASADAECSPGADPSDPSAAAALCDAALQRRLVLIFSESFPAFLALHGHERLLPGLAAAAERLVLSDPGRFLRQLLQESEARLWVLFAALGLPVGLRNVLLKDSLACVRGWGGGRYVLRDVLVLAPLLVEGEGEGERPLLFKQFTVYHPAWQRVLTAKVFCASEAGAGGGAGGGEALQACLRPWLGLGMHANIAAALWTEASGGPGEPPCACLLTEDCAWRGPTPPRAETETVAALPAEGGGEGPAPASASVCVWAAPALLTLSSCLPLSPGRGGERGAGPLALAAMADVARGLHFAHTHACPHGALSPDVVLVTRGAGAAPVVFKLTDFGLIGLEQDVSALPLAQRLAADVFSLGLLLLDIARGRLLAGADYQAWFRHYSVNHASANRGLIEASLAASGLPPGLLAPLGPLLAACLEEDWRQRPSARDVYEHLFAAVQTCGTPLCPPSAALDKRIFAPGNASNLAIAEHAAGGGCSGGLGAESAAWVRRVAAGEAASLPEIWNALLIRWRAGSLLPHHVIAVLRSLQGRDSSPSPLLLQAAPCDDGDARRQGFSATPAAPAEAALVEELVSCVLREGGYSAGDAAAASGLLARFRFADSDLAHSKLTICPSCCGGEASAGWGAGENFPVGLVVGDALSCLLLRRSARGSGDAAAADEIVLSETCAQAEACPGSPGSGSGSGTASSASSPIDHAAPAAPGTAPGALLSAVKTSGRQTWWRRDLGNDELVMTSNWMGWPGELMFTVGQFLVAFNQTLFINVVLGIDILPGGAGAAGEFRSVVLVVEGNNSSAAPAMGGGAGRGGGMDMNMDEEDARSDVEDIGFTNVEVG
jgi:hypothetical protein